MKELMSEMLPFFVPTSNNQTVSGKKTDLFQLNPALNGTINMHKLTMVAGFLGWSLNNLQGIGLDLPTSFWKRICDRNYRFTLDDLDELDSFRHSMLKQILEGC